MIRFYSATTPVLLERDVDSSIAPCTAPRPPDVGFTVLPSRSSVSSRSDPTRNRRATKCRRSIALELMRSAVTRGTGTRQVKKKRSDQNRSLFDVESMFCVSSFAEVAICANNNEIQVHQRNSSSWKLLETLEEHHMAVMGIDWAPKTNRIVTCSADKNAYVWTQKADGKWDPAWVLLRINRAATCVKWSPQGMAQPARLICKVSYVIFAQGSSLCREQICCGFRRTYHSYLLLRVREQLVAV